MNDQEAYEYIRAYLTRPGARQAGQWHERYDSDDGGDEWFTCCYIIEIEGDEHCCAAGCLLKPASAREAERLSETHQHGLSCVQIIDELPVVAAEWEGITPEFLREAQAEHDSMENWDASGFYVGALDRVAEKYHLEVVT